MQQNNSGNLKLNERGNSNSKYVKNLIIFSKITGIFGD